MNDFHIIFIFDKYEEDINIIGLFDSYKNAKKCFDNFLKNILDEKLLDDKFNIMLMSEDLAFLDENKYIEIRKIENINNINCKEIIDEIDNIRW